ncbi:MAG: bifunctional alpha,alpha-trehalose-phosphate synthase (UDP-forming)/trehalose-phosphatase, partial [Bacteroidales bacterium]|nr:bifunctional alpha,alpha-trehalose-phosphate synthase (UDP-forming)/trehalose-phosphatase [Bacteroidales bacterium]
MNRTLIVSHLLPLKIKVSKMGVKLEPRIGGYSSALKNFYDENNTAWLGTTGIERPRVGQAEKNAIEKELARYNCFPLYLGKKQKSRYLEGYANSTIWPLFHYFNEHSTYRPEDWESYVEVNQFYCTELEKIIEDGDRVWIHDFHLMLLPRMLREKFPELSIAYFQHIPFPSFELFRLLPQRIEILEGLLGADLIGFHTFDYERHFLSSVRRLLGLDTYMNQIRYEKRVLKVENFPMGIDFDKYNDRAVELLEKTPRGLKNFRNEIEKHVRGSEDRKIILSIDWLDYTKGLVNRLRIFRNFLQMYPKYHEKVSLLFFVTPPNESISEFRKIKSELDEQVGRINSEFGAINWTPVFYFYREMNFDEMVQVFLSSDVALITPIRDGLSLIAKEYLASRPDKKSALILSEMAGASKELGEALIVNPNNRYEVAEALNRAISMTDEEKIEMNSALRKRLSIYNETRWIKDFLKSLESVKKIQEYNLTRKINKTIIDSIINKYLSAEKRMIFLDYDGTLQGFFKDPQAAKPDSELYAILEGLTKDHKNQVVIISGRDKETLASWFEGDWHLGFIAEHGVWYRELNGDWKMMDAIHKDWMHIIRPTLEFYVDRTPRSFIEDKNYSLVWHYRNSDPDLGVQRSLELKDELQSLVTNLNLEIMDGDKVIEIKNSGINKGRAAQ